LAQIGLSLLQDPAFTLGAGDMGDGFQLLEIIVFAAIAGFLVLRLRNVLGRRTGTERRRDPFASPVPPTPPDTVVTPPRDYGTSVPPPTLSSPLAATIARLKSADPGFDEAAFLTGARGAFEIIVNAFAAGDTAALQPLLSDVVYAHFTEAIRARREQRETHETMLLSIKATEIAEAELVGDTANVTVKFVSDQINVTRAADGTVIDGDPEHVVEKIDLWTFSRSVRSRDPNWVLIATHSP
jgi:predicted lipid-binding transport protein (Tim44 family)